MGYHKDKFKVEWQMNRFNLSENEAKEKINKIKKSISYGNAYSVDFQMKQYNLTLEEAIQKINNFKEKIRIGQHKLSEYDYKAMCSKNKEYWLKKGYSENESILKCKEQVLHMQQAYTKKKKEHPELYKNKNNTTLGYWLDKGFNEEEAKSKLKDRQTTFSLEKCIQKYGEKEGKLKFEERQEKWQNNLKTKPIEEIKRINKLKGITLENMIRKWGEIEGTEKYNNWLTKYTRHTFYSNVSQELFYKLLENIQDKENVKFATHNKEKITKYNNKIYSYDFCYKNKIIEFNGDLLHANPEIYKEIDCPNPYNKDITAKQIWEYDELKNNVILNKGYKLLIIWEKDYNENKEKIINECLKFLEII
jgi:very-short-patch-repair endonuclease